MFAVGGVALLEWRLAGYAALLAAVAGFSLRALGRRAQAT